MSSYSYVEPNNQDFKIAYAIKSYIFKNICILDLRGVTKLVLTFPKSPCFPKGGQEINCVVPVQIYNFQNSFGRIHNTETNYE